MSKIEVTVYSRPACHLCDVVEATIRSAVGMELINLSIVNIDDDPMLQQRYQNDIPVVAIEGKEMFFHRVSAEEFAATITSLASKT